MLHIYFTYLHVLLTEEIYKYTDVFKEHGAGSFFVKFMLNLVHMTI